MSRNAQGERQSGGKTPEAIIVAVAEGNPEAEVALFRQRWRSTVPNAVFVGVSVGAAGSYLVELVASVSHLPQTPEQAP